MHNHFEVPFNNLREQSLEFSSRLLHEIAAILESGVFINGEKTRDFTSQLASFTEIPFLIPVGNGTDALEIALRSLGIGRDDRVVTVANAGGYGTAAIRQVGAEPTYVDVDDNDLQLSPLALLELLDSDMPKPKAVIVTHLFGAIGQVEEIVRICEENAIPVIEDCAQAMGTSSHGRHAGSFGTVATFSFYPTKNLGGVGDAGAIATHDETVARKAKSLAQYGWEAKYSVSAPFGRNSRIDEIQAAALSLRLTELVQANNARKLVYERLESSAPLIDFVHRRHPNFNAHLAVIRTTNRSSVQDHFQRRKIETLVHYPVPDHWQSAYPPSGVRLPITEKNSLQILSIPCHPRLDESQIEAITEALQEAPQL